MFIRCFDFKCCIQIFLWRINNRVYFLLREYLGPFPSTPSGCNFYLHSLSIPSLYIFFLILFVYKSSFCFSFVWGRAFLRHGQVILLQSQNDRKVIFVKIFVFIRCFDFKYCIQIFLWRINNRVYFLLREYLGPFPSTPSGCNFYLHSLSIPSLFIFFSFYLSIKVHFVFLLYEAVHFWDMVKLFFFSHRMIEKLFL